MQDNAKEEMKSLFKGACGFPAGMLAALIEMEHRINGEPREDLVSMAAEALTERLEVCKITSDNTMNEECDKLMVMAMMHELPMETVSKILNAGISADLQEDGDTNVM